MPTLRQARTQRLLTIRGVAKRAGVSPTTIQTAELGRRQPHFDTMRKIAAVLGVEPSAITEFRAAIEGLAEGKEAA